MILAIESSTPKGGLALLDPETDEVVFERGFQSDRAHNSVIFEPLEAALDSVEAKPSLIVVGTGPGSYGGVRVGIAVANALSVAFNAQVIGLPSICALETDVDDYLVAGDARRNSFYIATIQNRQLQAAPEVFDPDEFTQTITNSQLPVLSTDPKPPHGLEVIALTKPNALQLARLAVNAEIVNRPIEPLYIREPYITTPKRRGATIST
ncbi:MAG: tRNA (adenosine(37)-N6)-threonylcarbamoyltransferase complex dimerization subunit type 1 TsaB [Verrucomicrobiota bacterium]